MSAIDSWRGEQVELLRELLREERLRVESLEISLALALDRCEAAEDRNRNLGEELADAQELLAIMREEMVAAKKAPSDG